MPLTLLLFLGSFSPYWVVSFSLDVKVGVLSFVGIPRRAVFF